MVHTLWNLNLFSFASIPGLAFCCFSQHDYFVLCFYTALGINHLPEKLMHMTVDIATKRSVGIDDSILVGDDKSHFDRWNVKKLLFRLRYEWMLLLLLFPCCIAAGCSPLITWTITLAGSGFAINGNERRKEKIHKLETRKVQLFCSN